MHSGLVLVTGAAGFIGSNVVAMLAESDNEVAICDRFSDEQTWRYLAPHALHDIVAPEELLTWLDAHRGEVTAIIHMGAISATTETHVPTIITNNIRATLDLWEYCARTDTRFVYASSAATYGDGSAGFVDDDSLLGLSKLRPLNLYGWSKHFVDRRIASDAAHGRPVPSAWAGLKFFNVYGPNEGHKGPMRSVIHQLYPKAAAGHTVRLFKSDNPKYRDGAQLRDFVYVKDCCEIIKRVLAAPQIGSIFNAGTGRARTFEDLAVAVFRATGTEPRIDYIEMPASLRGKYQYRTEANVDKLSRFGLAPEFASLEAGISDYVQSHLVGEFGVG